MNRTMIAEDYMEKLEDLENRRQPIEKWWKKVTNNVLPIRAGMWETNAPPKESLAADIDSYIYDSYPVHGNVTLANGMNAYNNGPHSPWYKLKISVEWMNEIPGVKDWLEQCETIEYMLLHRFGFYDAAGEFQLDLTGFGTATMDVEENLAKGEIIFAPRRPVDSYLMQGRNGRVDTNYGVRWLTAREAVKRFGDGDDMPKDIVRDAEEKPAEKHKFLHVLEPREDANPDLPWAEEKPVAGLWIACEEMKIVENKGFDEMPAITARWGKNSGDTYGWSPNILCMSDIIRLQKVAKSDLEGRQLHNKKPLSVPRELRGKERIVPGGYNYYKDPTRQISAIDLGGTLPTVKDIVMDIHQTLDKHLYTDLFLMLQGVERQMTAREVVERKGEQVAALSSPLSRQNTEFLKPVVSRVFNIASNAGWFPNPPPALVRAWLEHSRRSGTSQKAIDMDFIGLLAQAQRRYQESQNTNAGLATLAMMNEQNPEAFVWDNFDFDDMSRGIGQSSGFRQSSIRELPDRDKIREARQKAMEQARQLEMAERAAGMIPDLSKAPEAGSPAEMVANQFSGVPQ